MGEEIQSLDVIFLLFCLLRYRQIKLLRQINQQMIVFKNLKRKMISLNIGSNI